MPEAAPYQLTLEDVVKLPAPGLNIPSSLQFSPDDTYITYLYSPEGSLAQQLFACEAATAVTRPLLVAPSGTTEETLSLAEALRRERARERALGVTSYAWAGAGQRLLIPLRGSLYIQDGLDGDLRLLVDGGDHPCLDPRFSPDGQTVAYVWDDELYGVPVAGGEPRQLTRGASGTGRSHGLAEYIAQEEMGRSHGFWWSPDSQWLAFTEVDETHIPVFRIMHQGKAAVGDSAQEDHRYPFAGKANANVRLGVVAASGGDPIWLDLGEDEDIYLARVNWLGNGRLTAQLLNRAQSRLDLWLYDRQTGERHLLLQESSDVWINLHNLFRPIRKLPDGEGSGFIWASERTGFRHLYLYSDKGELIRPLTQGQWMVDSIVGIDSRRGQLYFTATEAAPTESHLYAVSLAGGAIRRLTGEPGTHSVVIDHKKATFLDVYHAANQPPQITQRSLEDGRILQAIFTVADERIAAFNLPTPQIVTLPNRDGVPLYGAIYKPPAAYGDGPFPTIVSVYGGPHAQRVTNSWGLTVDMRAQYLASRGFLVFKLDNQGSARRGLAFESPIRHDMGHVEVQDQVDGVRWLVEQGLTDPARVGIYGWSYGGYMAAMCLARAADTFKVAVAGAPVTHWDGYDTCYTERYMGTPQTNAAGYERSSVMAHLDKMTGKLLLVHGLIDENVHFRHTARLVNSLIAARKPYELLLFPNERHMPRQEADRFYMEERICAFFETHL